MSGSSQLLSPELCHWFLCICPMNKSLYMCHRIFYILKPWLINECILYIVFISEQEQYSTLFLTETLTRHSHARRQKKFPLADCFQPNLRHHEEEQEFLTFVLSRFLKEILLNDLRQKMIREKFERIERSVGAFSRLLKWAVGI